MTTPSVMADLGYTVLPKRGVRAMLKRGDISASPISDLSITWMAARPKTRSLGVAANGFTTWSAISAGSKSATASEKRPSRHSPIWPRSCSLSGTLQGDAS